MQIGKIEVNVNGKYYPLEQAYGMIIKMFTDTHTLCDHPDLPKEEEADSLIHSLKGKGIFSEKVEAIIEYDHAFKKILKHIEYFDVDQ